MKTIREDRLYFILFTPQFTWLSEHYTPDIFDTSMDKLRASEVSLWAACSFNWKINNKKPEPLSVTEIPLVEYCQIF